MIHINVPLQRMLLNQFVNIDVYFGAKENAEFQKYAFWIPSVTKD